MFKLQAVLLAALCALLCQCGSSTRYYHGPANMGGPTKAERAAAIASEETGNFFYGRRYHVKKTRFWGYLRKPRQSVSQAKLVLMDESRKRVPDRLHEDGPPGRRYGYDHNYEYKIYGHYTGEEGYDPNSNLFLPIFRLTDYKLIDKNPGWLFDPSDHYDPYSISLHP